MPNKYKKLTSITENNKYSKNIYGGLAVYFGNKSKQYASKDPTKYLSQRTPKPSVPIQTPSQSKPTPVNKNRRPLVTRDPGMSAQRPLPSKQPSVQNREPVTNNNELIHKLSKYVTAVVSLKNTWLKSRDKLSPRDKDSIQIDLDKKIANICKIHRTLLQNNYNSQDVRKLARSIFWQDNDGQMEILGRCLKPFSYGGGKKNQKPAYKKFAKK